MWTAVLTSLHRLAAWHTLDRSLVVALAVSAIVAWVVVMVEPNPEDADFDTWSNINPLDERN
jgi:hypothetical protein